MYNFKKANYVKFRSLLKNAPWDSLFITKDINIIWEKWKDLFLAAADASIPKAVVKSKNRSEWLSKETRIEIKRKRRMYRIMRRSYKERDIEKYKRQSNKVRFLTRRDHTYHLQKITCNLRTNPRPFWRWLKSTRNGKTTIPDILNTDGATASTNAQKATIFNDHFSSVFTREDNANIPELEEEISTDSNPDTIEDLVFDSAEVLEELSNINANKCGGPDGIPAILLKEGAQSIAPILARILNYSLEVGSLPRDWTRANVIPIHKKGNRHNPNNYRPISLTGHVVKIAERLIAMKIRQFVSPLITPVQHGFRPNHSCLTQLLQTIHCLAQSLDKGLSSHAVFLDFSKAFDSVPHQRLLLKLKHIGIRGRNLKWIEAFLTDREQRVIIQGQSSNWVKVTSGVPQGTVLGPLLFLIYINDLANAIRHSSIRLFADDCVLFKAVRSASDCEELQEDLGNIQSWCAKWQLRLNPAKCKAMNVTNKRNTIPCHYQIDAAVIEEVDSYKYLGVTVDNKLKWNHHVKATVARANGTLSLLRRTMYGCTRESKIRAYEAIVKPVLMYGEPAWRPSTRKAEEQLERVQKRAARWINARWLVQEKRWDTTYLDSLSSLQWLSLSNCRLLGTNCLTYKILHHYYPVLSPHIQPSTRHSHRLLCQNSRINSFRYSFFINAPFLWNDLPIGITSSASFTSFKHALSTHLYASQSN